MSFNEQSFADAIAEISESASLGSDLFADEDTAAAEADFANAIASISMDGSLDL